LPAYLPFLGTRVPVIVEEVEKMAELKHVDVTSAMKVMGAVYALLGLVYGVLMAMFGFLLSSMFGTGSGNPLLAFGMMGIGAIIIMPIMMGVIGAIGGAICSVIYNFIAGMWGGLVVDLK
jgi:hypothetical protein